MTNNVTNLVGIQPKATAKTFLEDLEEGLSQAGILLKEPDDWDEVDPVVRALDALARRLARLKVTGSVAEIEKNQRQISDYSSEEIISQAEKASDFCIKRDPDLYIALYRHLVMSLD